MAWSKNGPRCPNCGTPISSRIPVVKAKWHNGRKKKINLTITARNHLLEFDGEAGRRCLACFLCLSCCEKESTSNSKAISPCYLAQQAFCCWEQAKNYGLVSDPKPPEFFFRPEISDFASYWKWFADELRREKVIEQARIEVSPLLKEGAK